MLLFSKVWVSCFVFPLIYVYDVLLDIRGRLRGQSIIEESLKGTYCGFCKQLPVSVIPRSSRSTLSGSYQQLLASTVPMASTNRHGLQTIVTEGLPMVTWKCSIGCLVMHSSDDIGSCICTERAAPDTSSVVRCNIITYLLCLLTSTKFLRLVPFPPTSERPRYRVAYRTHIHDLDNDSLLQIFNYYQLEHKENWNGQLQWRKLTQICQRWRHLIYDLSSHLDISLLLTNESPSLDTLGHLPPLPLVIDYSNRTGTMAQKDADNINFGLQQHDRVLRVALCASSSSLCTLRAPMSKRFPKLEDLSLLSTTFEEMNLILPETFQAPYLRRLALHGVGLRTKLTLLSFTITLSTLTLTNIGASVYFPPGHLVTQLRGLSYLEELSIGFAIPIPVPSTEGELLLAPISPVTSPSLRRLTFHGVDTYLDNLVAQINTPRLEQLSLTLFFGLAFTLVNLNEFIRMTEGVECLIAKVVFNKKGASMYQRGTGELSLHVNCERLDWKIDSISQVCSALATVVSTIEELTLDLDVECMPSDWENTLDSMLWHELLLPFVGVKKLHIGSLLTLEISQALHSVPEELVPEFLPELQELEIQLGIYHAKDAFFEFVKTRESVGRPVALLASPVPHTEVTEPNVPRGHPLLSSPPPLVSKETTPAPVQRLDHINRRSLTSTVKQVFTNYHGSVVRISRTDYTHLSCL